MLVTKLVLIAVVDFLFVIIELFRYLLWLRRYKWKSVKSTFFERGWIALSANFRWKGVGVRKLE